jgi:predicted GIY-YIG superfamily endonuclease
MGFVYAIICYDTGEIYIGSTTQPMYVRIAKHRHFNDYDGPTASKPIILREQYEVIIVRRM